MNPSSANPGRPPRPSTTASTSTTMPTATAGRGPRPKALPFALAPAVAAVACDPNNQAFHNHEPAAAALPPAQFGADTNRPTDHVQSSSLPSPPSSSEPARTASPPPQQQPASLQCTAPMSPRIAEPETHRARPVHPFFQPRRKPDPTPANPPLAPSTTSSNDIVDLTTDQSSPISPPALPPPPPPSKPVHPFFSGRPSTAPAPELEPTLRRSTRRRRPTQTAADDSPADPTVAIPSSSPKRKRPRTSSSSKQRKPTASAARKLASDDEFVSDTGDSDVFDEAHADPDVLEQARILAMIQARKRSDDLMRKFYKPPAGDAALGVGQGAGGGFFAPKQRKRQVDEVVVVDADGDSEVQVVERDAGEQPHVDQFNHPIRKLASGSKVKEVPAPWPSRENMHVGRVLASEPRVSRRHTMTEPICISKIDTAPIPSWLLADLDPRPLAPTLTASSFSPNSPHSSTQNTLLWTDKYAPCSIRDLCGSHLRHAGRQILAWLQEQLSASGSECVGAPKRVRDRVLGAKSKRGDAEMDDFVVEDSDVESAIESDGDQGDNEHVDRIGSGSDQDEADDHVFDERDPSDDDDFIGPSSRRRHTRNPHAPRRPPHPAHKSKPRYGPGALVLSGPSGAGKSAHLHALCAQLALTLFEVHPGHRRAARDIEQMLGQVADTHTVRAPIGSGGVLVVDAANVVFEEDRSMWQGVASVAVKTRRPLVIVVDDECEDEVPRDLVHIGLKVRIERPSVEAVVRRVAAVMKRERPNVEWSDNAIKRVVAGRGIGGQADLRAALMQVQFESARPVVHDAGEQDFNGACLMTQGGEALLDGLAQQLDLRAACDVLESAVDRAIPYRSQPELPPATHPDSLAVDTDTTLVVPSCIMYHQAAVAVDKTVEWIQHLLPPRVAKHSPDVHFATDPPALVKILHAWTRCQRSGAPTVTPTGMRVDLVPAITHLARLDLVCMDEADMAMAAAASGGARRTRRRMYKPAVRLEGVKREELEEIVAHRSVFCIGEGEHDGRPGADLEVGLLE